MFTKKEFGRKEKRENQFGKKTQIALLSLIFISISISLAGITAYVVGDTPSPSVKADNSKTCDPIECINNHYTICCPNSNSCIAWWADENNCGACGRVCPTGTQCSLNDPTDYDKGASCK